MTIQIERLNMNRCAQIGTQKPEDFGVIANSALGAFNRQSIERLSSNIAQIAVMSKPEQLKALKPTLTSIVNFAKQIPTALQEKFNDLLESLRNLATSIPEIYQQKTGEALSS